MALVTALDRLIQAGGTGVTLVLWLLSIFGALVTVYGPVPGSLWLPLTGIPLAIVWLRALDMTVTELLVRIGLTRLRYFGRD